MKRTSRRIRFAIVFAVCVSAGAAPAAAQSPAPTGNAAASETGPMNCWWRTDKRAVRVGEPFALTLTCRVMETADVKVVPSLSELEPTSIELTPFDVVEGTRHEDIVAPPWRYLQYVYTVRLLGDEFFGQDVGLPATNVAFRIQSGGTETVEGNEHRYVLPPLRMRILSFVAADAGDIQDPAADSFAAVEARRFRSTMELVAATISFGFAAVLLIMAGLRARERFKKRGPIIDQTIPAPAVLAGCLREVKRVRAEALRDGWTSSLALQALAPFRVAGAIALHQPFAHAAISGDASIREGQLALRHGLLRQRHAVVSAPITAAAMDRLRTSSNGHRRARQDVVDPIREALLALNVVRYGRNGSVDAAALDRTLDDGCHAIRRLRVGRLWPARAAAALAKPAALFDLGAWRR